MKKFHFYSVWLLTIGGVALSINLAVALQGNDKIEFFQSFVDNFIKSDYDRAFLVLHPKLQKLWGFDDFKNDLAKLKKSTNEDQVPVLASTYFGESPQGPYKQVGYQFGLGAGQESLMELTAIEINKKEYIIKLDFHLPYLSTPPIPDINIVKQFETAMKGESFNEIQKLMTDDCAKRFTTTVLKQIRPIMFKDDMELERNYYRYCVNSKWYDTVIIHPKGTNFTFIEIFLKTNSGVSKIVSLSFKGRMQAPIAIGVKP